jgi:hypothetical protein
MKKSFSTRGVFGGALMVLILASGAHPAAAAGPLPDEPVSLSMRETPSTCISQVELRKIAEHRCEQIDAMITNVKFIDLCGAKGSEPMYSTILYDCHPSRALH